MSNYNVSSQDWAEVERETFVTVNLESTPLQIKCNTAVDNQVVVSLYSADNRVTGAFALHFSTPQQYHLGYCSGPRRTLPQQLPYNKDDMALTIVKKPGPILEVYRTVNSDNTLVIRAVLSDSFCDNTQFNWRNYWIGASVNKIKFSGHDTASMLYKKGKDYIFHFRNI